MKLRKIHVCNYRSVVDSGEFAVSDLQALVGENNAGKSNLLKAISIFLSSSAGGCTNDCFHDKSLPITIKATFEELDANESNDLRTYLIGGKLILEKHLTLATDSRTEKSSIATEYHGYKANPKDWWLSVERVVAEKGKLPKWKEIATENGILTYVQDEKGGVQKKSYEEGLRRYLTAHPETEYDEPVLGTTQALGLQPNLLSRLPDFYLLEANADYSDEIDKRSKTTTFRRLMGELATRLLVSDPNYAKIETALSAIKDLLNPAAKGCATASGNVRLPILETIESTIKADIAKLMPSVQAVSLLVAIEETKEFFTNGVSLKVDDGVLNDVLDKGHGMQRAIVFSLLQALIKCHRGVFAGAPSTSSPTIAPSSIILCIEEPELYIHPQLQRMIYRVLGEFSANDQVVYTTHSPAFVDVWNYESIAVIRKDSVKVGTKVHQCTGAVFGDGTQKRSFQMLNSFGLSQNSLFFAKKSILVEGPQDEIGILATARKLKLIEEFPEEAGFTIVVCGSKGQIPKFQALLNAFNLPYTALLEMDGKPASDPENAAILSALSGNAKVSCPDKIEDLAGVGKHFDNSFHAMQYFATNPNIPTAFESLVRQLFV